MRSLFVAAAIFAASPAMAEMPSDTEAGLFGFYIVEDAVCGTRLATLSLAKMLNRGVTLQDLKARKADILQGKAGAKADLAKQGKRSFCPKSDNNPSLVQDYARDVHMLGYTFMRDQLCGTHIYDAVLTGMKRRGELYPNELNDYAEEFEKGKHTASVAFEHDGETKSCRDDRRSEAENADFQKIIRTLGIAEQPSWR
jgi:hypothetical protein